VSDLDHGRTLRRRHMHERQAVVFGVLLAGLAVAGLGAAALYTDALDLPFLDREFSAEPTEAAEETRTYCPPEGALPVATGEITVDVYNGSGLDGLAGETANALTERGYVIGGKGNAPSEVTGAGRIIYGAAGIQAAYTLQAYVPDAVLQLDGRTDTRVDLVVGTEFAGILPPDQVALDPAAPLLGPEGCIPFTELTAPPADAEQPADAAG